MFSRFRIAFGLALLLALAFALPVFAGGWAVITLDGLPTDAVAGETLTIGFTVLQHGRTPMDDLDPTVNVHLDKTNAFVVHATRDGKPGHYIATLTFPKAGVWEWSVQAFSMDQRMPALNVAAPAAGTVSEPVSKTEPTQNPSISTVWIVRALALGIGVAGLVIAFRRKNRLAYALTALCLLIGLGSFAIGSGVPVSAEPQSQAPVRTAPDEALSQVELGRQLFVAKGCITCHVNRKIANSFEYWTIDMGATDLSNFSASTEVLFIRLKDPAAAKSDTKMPNLGLKEAEIEALIAFINSK